MIVNSFTLMIVNVIHFLVILFVVLTPFSNNTLLLLLHSFVIPFIMMHWYLNNDTCAITVMEKAIREQLSNGTKVSDQECFSHKIIGPVYNFVNEHVDYSNWTWMMTTILWLITMYKMYGKYQSGSLQQILNISNR